MLRTTSVTAAALALSGCAASSSSESTRDLQLSSETATLAPVSGHAALHIGSWAPWTTEISKTVPASINAVPEHSPSAVFGEFSFGDGTRYRKEASKVGFMLDEDNERFVVDENRNGSLADDRPANWVVERRPVKDGKETIGIVTVRAPVAASRSPNAELWNVALFFQEKGTRAKYGQELEIDRYRDYATEGFIQLGGKTYRVLLDDGAVTGDFSFSPDDPRQEISLRIDVNGNGRYEHRGEEFSAEEPFTIGGVTYQVSRISKDGRTIELVRSDKSVPEISPPPDLSVGRTPPPFTATTLSGEKIEIPGSFAGKVVFVDFWATWCGPCLKELPYLKRAYEMFHERGFEIVSVSIDEQKNEQKWKDLIAKQELSWHQVIDSGGWNGAVISLYAPPGIPAGYLIKDGKIVATMDSLRGEQLLYTLEELLPEK